MAGQPSGLSSSRKCSNHKKGQEDVSESIKECRAYINKIKTKVLQPGRRHYGGQGYAKDSVFVELTDPAYAGRCKLLWDEHIAGFSGKPSNGAFPAKSKMHSLTKEELDLGYIYCLNNVLCAFLQSMKNRKSERDESMLWRQRLHQKQAGINVPSVDAVVAQMAQIKKKVAANLPSVCAPYVKHTSSSTKELKLGTKPQQHLAGGSVNTDKKQNRDGKAKKAKMTGDAQALQQEAMAAYRALKRAPFS